ncbi:MlaD family protein [Chitinophaga rhizosphaerae]|uniref:MlaD family protein n=1 Tax=Chitinophaga rhizosphaerae TaxID=1864947 RepID=UPI000F80C8E7|nr:MlaD family protein [Chitinophaga rhizosphaerae]
MNDKSTKRGVIVGIFVFIGLLIFVAGILILGGQKKTFMSSLGVVAVFHDIGGLAKGDNVWYSGVKVGTIKSISFLGHDRIQVRMEIDKRSREFIHKDVVAKVSSDGLVGNKIIALSGGTAGVPAVEDGDTIAVVTAISSDELLETLQVNNKSLVEITGNLKTITKKIADGEGSLGRLISSDTVYNDLKGAIAGLQRTTENTRRITANLTDYTGKLQRKGSLANDLVTDTIVFSNLRSSMSRIESASKGIDSVMNNLQAASASVNDNLKSSKTPAGMLLNDEATAQSLKTTIRNLQSSTYKLDENMEALQHNFLLRGFFRRRDKAEAKEQKRLEKEAERARKDSLSAQ